MTERTARYSPIGLLHLTLDHGRLLLGVPALALLTAVGFTLLFGGSYTASSSFRPQTRQSETARLASLASQFGFSAGGLGGQEESVDFYARLATSRSLLEQVVLHEYRFPERVGARDSLQGDLISLLRIDGATPAEQRQEAVESLQRMITVGLDIDAGVVTLTTAAPWPGLAVQMNRVLLDEINRFNLEKRQSRAGAERRFTEAQVERARSDLESAESELSRFLERNRLYEQWAQTRLEAARLQRRVDLHQQVYTTLAQSLEQARVEEVRNTPVITILDPPEGSARRAEGLLRNGILAALLGLALVIGVVFVREYADRLRAEAPEEFGRLLERGRRILPARRPVRRG